MLALSPNEIFAKKASRMQIGLVTYLWGKDWDLATLIRNCEKSKVLGVELRTQHKHGVEPSLNANQRKEVKKRFADSQVTLLGYGANEQFDSPDLSNLKKNIEATKVLLQLSHDVGGSGVKVKPNAFHEGVPQEKTLEQIGRSLNELGKFASGLGQKVRLEVHGTGTQELPNIKKIMDVADNRNVVVCWNCNPEDLNGQGLEYNFNLVKDRLGDTVHVREMNMGDYPYQELMNLFVKMDYKGWILLECRTDPQDKVAAMIEQREVWKKMINNALAIR
jgi:sugar phosphate isomerase/epimerase